MKITRYFIPAIFAGLFYRYKVLFRKKNISNKPLLGLFAALYQVGKQQKIFIFVD